MVSTTLRFRGPQCPTYSLPTLCWVPLLALCLALPLTSWAGEWDAALQAYEQWFAESGLSKGLTGTDSAAPTGRGRAAGPELKTDGLLRIVSPVRFSASGEPAAVQARSILAKYAKHGYNRALWAVDELPEEPEQFDKWMDAALSAFESPPVLAVDTKLIQARLSPAPETLAMFLRRVLPHVHSVVLNHRHLSNFSCGEEPAAMGVVEQNFKLIRAISPHTFTWLYLNDAPWFGDDHEGQWQKHKDKLIRDYQTWVQRLKDLPDGYFLYCQHPWTARVKPECIEQAKFLLGKGRPVIRAGLEYRSPRLRPGIEGILNERYARRMKAYEQWVGAAGFRGYSRVIGSEIPKDMWIPIGFLPMN